MNKTICSSILILFALLGFQNLNAQESKPWFQDGSWNRPVTNPKAKVLPIIKVEGNKFVNPEGKTFLQCTPYYQISRRIGH